MIPETLSGPLGAAGPALGDHIWQSTLFLVMAGLLTLLFLKNQARTRYWLWLAASAKFLIPFSLLAGIGSHVAWSGHSIGANELSAAMDGLSHPFAQAALPAVRNAASTPFPLPLNLLPEFLGAAWLLGLVAVVCVWCLRWRRIRLALEAGIALREGREVETLRRLERIGGTTEIEMLLSPASLEPAVFGIVRPTLVWPERISERLDDAQLETILAHEVWHVRRRDNLTAVIHMAVEAIFWFHPLVWWLGARLVEERERACDEQVLELGGQRQVYAEGILRICQFCVESPLTCFSGATGADLKNRIVRIMTARVANKVSFSRKLLLAAAGFLSVGAPILSGFASATPGSISATTQSHRLRTAAFALIPRARQPVRRAKGLSPQPAIGVDDEHLRTSSKAPCRVTSRCRLKARSRSSPAEPTRRETGVSLPE